MKNSFQRFERLGGNKRIEQLFLKGHHLFSFPFKVVWQLTNRKDSPWQVAISVSKKNHKKATVRNLIKRRMREAFRTQKTIWASGLVEPAGCLECVIIYVGKEGLPYSQIRDRMAVCLKKILSDCEKNPDLAADRSDPVLPA